MPSTLVQPVFHSRRSSRLLAPCRLMVPSLLALSLAWAGAVFAGDPAPQLEEPADGAAFCPSGLMSMTWGDVPSCADDFLLELALGPDFIQIVETFETPNLFFLPPSDLAPDAYFWRVSACGVPSEVRRFEIFGDCGLDGTAAEQRADTGGATSISDLAIGAACDGRVLAAWVEETNGQRQMRARFAQGTTFLGPPILAGSAGDPSHATVRFLANGTVVLAWGDGTTLRWRVFDATSLQLLDQQDVFVPTAPEQVDLGPAGEVAAAWTDGSFLRGHRHAVNGAFSGSFDFQETSAGVDVVGVDLGQSDDGFTLLWRWALDDAGFISGQIKAQRFTALNQPVGDEVIVRDALGVDGAAGQFLRGDEAIQVNPAGDFAVHTKARLRISIQGNLSTTERIELLRFTADGSPAGGLEEVYGSGVEPQPAELTALDAAANGGGQVAVVWNDEFDGFLGRRMLGDDAPASGPELALSDRTALDAAVALASPGAAAAILWVSDECGPDAAPCVYFRPLRSGPGLLADGFESGDFSGWCRRTP